MDLTVERQGEIVVAHLAGEIDSNTSPLLQQTLLPLVTQGSQLVLDMSRVTYLSSAGLRTLLLLYRQVTQVDGRIVLAGLSEMIWDTMAVTGFLDFFSAYRTLDEAVVGLAG